MLRIHALRGLLAGAGMILFMGACGGGSSDDEPAGIETPSPDNSGTGTGGGGATGTGGGSGAGNDPGPSAPMAVPGTFEAEDFDRGGEAVGYHDNVRGNAGGQYRLNEDVDIVVSSDPIGGRYDVSAFETGEWLAYTINVADTADYDLAVRAANGVSGSAFHIEIDGRDVTGPVTVANTGSADGYLWVGASRTGLTAGQHLMKVVADQYFELNSIRVTAVPVSSPYFGTPIVVPGTFEAEDFDLGGEGAGYRDNVAGNVGGQYRLQEDADISASADAQGIYDIVHFESGEWLAYTVNVASSGGYNIEVRAATHPDFPNSAFHVEVDGRDVTGSVVLPDTGSWSNYQWLGQRTIVLNAGMHQLKVVSDQPYFNLNSIRVSSPTTTPPPPPPPSSGATLLFKSGFEGATALGPLVMYSTGAWQDILGIDSESGFAWPPKLWGGTTGRFQLIAGDSEQVTAITLPGYTYNELQSVTGHNGTATRALFSTVQKSVGGALVNWDSTQNDFGIFPGAAGQGDLYLSYWLKFQPDLLQRMTVNSWAGRVVTDWKTGGSNNAGDYRVILSVYGDRAGNRLYWNARGDNIANGGLPQQIFWEQNNFAVPVPVGQWFRVEVFVHRSAGADGRVWVAANGQQLFDRRGSNMGVNNLPWNRIFAFLNYSSGQSLPAYQWADDLEVWNGFPSTASPH